MMQQKIMQYIYMIIISPQLDDWGEESANDTIALVEYFLNNVNIDESKVYISGASGGGETLSIVFVIGPGYLHLHYLLVASGMEI